MAEREPYIGVMDNTTFFCLNGNSGTLRANEEDSSKLDFEDEEGNVYTISNSADVSVVGGILGSANEFDNIDITFNSGTINALYGASYNVTDSTPEEFNKVNITVNGGQITSRVTVGIGRNHVQEGTVTINGGTIKNVSAGIKSFVTGYGDCNSSNSDENSDAYVLNSNLIINGGTITSTAYVGGSSGYNYTKYGYCEVNGGIIPDLLSASNGNVDEICYQINGGEIDILHPGNRGNVKKATIVINDGKVNLYCGCDTIDSNETGTVEAVSVVINGGEVMVYAGVSGSEPITAESGILQSLTYVAGTAEFEDGFLEEFADVVHEIEATGTPDTPEPSSAGSELTFGTGSLAAIEKALEAGQLSYPAYIYDTNGDHILRFVTKEGAVQEIEGATLIDIDEMPTPDSENAVSSGGVYKYVKEYVDEMILGAIKEDY